MILPRAAVRIPFVRRALAARNPDGELYVMPCGNRLMIGWDAVARECRVSKPQAVTLDLSADAAYRLRDYLNEVLS